MKKVFLQSLQKKLQLPLPGHEAQLLMTPTKSIVFNKSTDYRTACVMVLLAPIQKTWQLCLIQRQLNPLDIHSGQISLPGGKLEISDQSHLDCALRETFEEIGVPIEHINPIGKLTTIYTFASNFNIHPFVGYMEQNPIFALQSSEVQRVFTYPVERLLDPLSKGTTSMKLSNGIQIENVPFYKSDHGVIWGATAMILSELEQILQTH